MTTIRPRVQVTLDDDTNNRLSRLAEQNAVSVSATAAGLIRQALDINQDIYLSEISDKRLVEDDGVRFLHGDAWT